MSEYKERDVELLDDAGDYYIRHVEAMTKEGLHSKSDIAAELAFRDRRIDLLSIRIKECCVDPNRTHFDSIGDHKEFCGCYYCNPII